jgi:hypothetical protein
MKIQKIYVGGWFQRTVLHLVEIYDFLKGADSPLDLDKEKLNNFRDMLKIDSLEMKIGDLEYINIISKYGIEFKIYEDGLIMLSKNPELSIEDDIKSLTSYYEEKLSPGLSYIFSLGAPMPKELADIKTIYPYFLVLDKADRKDIESLLSNFKQEKYFEIKRKSFEIYRGDKLYIINNISEKFSSIEKFVEEQTFIREFNGQLHRYLNLHRVIWERIAEVKEKGEIRGRDVGSFADKVESYSKTINLIETRIKQMGTYIRTREAIIKNNKELAEFIDVLQFKHEALSNTLKYIMEIWQMTKNYVNSAINLFTSIQAKSTENSVTNLAIITSMGVGATLISLFTQKKPNFTLFGALYFFILIFIGYSTNQIMKMIYRNRRYKIRDIEVAKDIK